MTTTPSSGHQVHEVHADGLRRARDRLRHGAANERAGVRSRDEGHRIASSRSAALSCEDAQIRASWTTSFGRCELTVRWVPPGLQVKQCTWLDSGSVLDEVFMLHSRAEFERWHAASPTKFDHPVAHDEIRRFAHASLAT